MFLCCPISAASGSHFLLATNHSAFILTVFRRCEGNTFSSCRPSYYCLNHQIIPAWFPKKFPMLEYKLYYFISLIQTWRRIPAISHHVSTFLSIKQHANLCPRSLHITIRLSPYPAKSHRLVGCFNSKSYNTAHICHFVLVFSFYSA